MASAPGETAISVSVGSGGERARHGGARGGEAASLEQRKLHGRKLRLCQLYPCLSNREVALGLFPETCLDHDHGAAAAVVPPLTVAGEHSLNKGHLQEARLRIAVSQHEEGGKPWHSTWRFGHAFFKEAKGNRVESRAAHIVANIVTTGAVRGTQGTPEATWKQGRVKPSGGANTA